MDFIVNNNKWSLNFEKLPSKNLMRSDSTYTFGVTDNNSKKVTIADNLSNYMTNKVLCHELTHVYSFENGCDIDVATEEIIADFMSLYGRDIVYLADDILSNVLERKYG